MPSTSSPDLIAGRYRLDALLGRGGMGEVRAGTDLRLDRPVAVKLLRAELSDQPELRTRFEREARAAARISHPNVVAVYDTGEHHGVPYIVMERLEGNSLANELSAGRLSETRACMLILETLSALDAAHQLGVLHRDIKPGNILLGFNGHAKVADFGIAKVAEDTDPATTGVLLGTAAYVSPERLAGAPATPTSDVYAVGVVLFESLAGRPPFSSDTPLGLVRSIAADAPPSLAAIRPDVHAAVVAVTEKAIAKDPARRFGSAASMAVALANATSPSPSAADGPTVPIATARAARQAAEAVPIAPTEVVTTPPPAAGPSEPHARPSSALRYWLAAAIGLFVVMAIVIVAFTMRSDDSSPAQSTTTTPAADTTGIPGPLRQSIDRLDQAVQP
jgi:eukaryotic-like serine/threonine-protein kinase